MSGIETLPPRIDQVIDPWVALCPERLAIADADAAWSFGELREAVNAAKLCLIRQGVIAGDRVMIVHENCVAAVALLFAVAALDAWSVPVSARLATLEIDAIRRHCQPRCIAFTLSQSPQARAHAVHHSARVTELYAATRLVGPVAFLRCADYGVPEPRGADGANQVAVLIYTSGTTGAPKGVMLTHRNLLFVAQVSGAIRSLDVADRFYGVMPLAHIVGITVMLLGTLMRGASLHLAPRFNPAALLDAMERQSITIMIGVPATYALLLDYAQGKGIATLRHRLRLIGTCGALLDPAIKAATESLFGMTLHNGYGATECAPTVAQTRTDAPRADCAVGPPIPGIAISITNAEGRPVPDGEIGELRVRGPNIMRGYYRDQPATDAVLDAEGWFNTRDLARIENGALFIAGRAKELIIRFGFNVYPPEIEAALNAHPAVVQSAVIGQPVAGNEEIIAFVQAEAGSPVTVASLAAHAAARLAPYKRPTKIIIVATLPASASGKILKAKLAMMLPAWHDAESNPGGEQSGALTARTSIIGCP